MNCTIRTNLILNTLSYSLILLQIKRNKLLFISLKSDFSLIYCDEIFTIGPTLNLTQKSDLYLGGGIDYSYQEAVIELGTVCKFNRIALDFGLGFIINDMGYANIGIGFNF